MTTHRTLQLASKSPRRTELLAQIGIQFTVIPVEFDETPFSKEVPNDYVIRLSRGKARAGFLASSAMPTLGADTIVVIDDTILGKPRDKDDAYKILRSLSGRTHSVLTAVALCSVEQCEHILVETQVRFRAISDEEIHAYWRSGEPKDKAGAYAIQGLGAVFIEEIKGSYSAVVGLPLNETARLCKKFSIQGWWNTPTLDEI